jgi:hypothetical protein
MPQSSDPHCLVFLGADVSQAPSRDTYLEEIIEDNHPTLYEVPHSRRNRRPDTNENGSKFITPSTSDMESAEHSLGCFDLTRRTRTVLPNSFGWLKLPKKKKNSTPWITLLLPSPGGF